MCIRDRQGGDKQTNFILFKGNALASSTTVFIPVTLVDIEPQLGQTIIGVGGADTNSVSVGRVSSLDMKESGLGTSTTKYLAGINTDFSSGLLVDGSPIFNLNGDVMGIKLSSDSSKLFTPTSVLKKEMSVLLETPKTP